MQSLLFTLTGTPNQTRPQTHFVNRSVSLCSTVSPWKQKPHLLTPVSQVSRPVPEPSSHHVTPENLSDLKDNSLQMLNVFPLKIPSSLLMQIQNSTAIQFSRMLHSLYGIKISHKNTLEKIFFSPLWRLLRYYGILNHYIQTATNLC